MAQDKQEKLIEYIAQSNRDLLIEIRGIRRILEQWRQLEE